MNNSTVQTKKDAPGGAPDPLMRLHGNIDLNTAFEFKGQMIVVDRHSLKQLPNEVLIVLFK